MPKGIYNRSKAVPGIQEAKTFTGNPGKVNIQKVTEIPDRQSANANVEVIEQTQGLNEVSTTERLFGDVSQRDKLDETDPNRTEFVPQAPEEVEEKEVQPEAPKPEPKSEIKPEEEFIDWEKMAGKKIKQKIDGKEVIVTAEELKKYSDQDQIKKHLADAADKVGEERRKLAEERKQIQELRQQRQPQYEAPIRPEANGQLPGIQQPQNDPVLQRIQFLETQLQQLAQGTQPVIYQSNRQRVSDELKGQGFNDFLDYIPKMEMEMSRIQDPNLMSFYDSPQGAKALYFQLKAQDMNKTPIIVPRGTDNPTAPVTKVDSGSQASTATTDDSGMNYRQAFRRAVSSGDNKEAWNEVLRQKGILPE